MKKSIAFLIFTSLWAGSALAQTKSFQLSPDSAEKIIQGCKQHSRAKQQSHAIAVYDKGGNLVAALRMQGNGPGIMAFSQAKAKAVSSWGFSTAGMEEAVQSTPGFANAPFVVTVAGGVAVYTADGGHLIGSVGVSGEAPIDDVACAVAGIEAAGLSATRKRN